MLKSILYLSLLTFILASCRKGERIDQESYMRVALGAYHPDTSVFAQVKINGEILTNSQQFHGDEPFNIFLQYGTVTHHDSALLDVLLVKGSGASMVYRDTVKFANLNDLFLFQTCPESTPFLIDRRKGEMEAPLPANDSVKLRFFYSSGDKIKNPNAGYTDKIIRRMRLQVYTFTEAANPNNPPPASSFISVVNALDFDECGLSNYVTLAKNKKYGFRLRDISPGIPSSASANLVQQLLPDTDIQIVNNPSTGFSEWDFKRGKIFIASDDPEDKFQTLRIKRSTD